MDGAFRAADVPDDIYDAIKCVTKVFEDALASGKHKPGDWRVFNEADISERLHDHLWRVDHPKFLRDDDDPNEDHLANLCCRALMLLQLREESKLKGPKG